MSEQLPYTNKWGEEILGEYVEHTKASNIACGDIEAMWQLQRVRPDACGYNREFAFVRYNASRSQSFRAGEFTRETARALRDMLSAVLDEEES